MTNPVKKGVFSSGNIPRLILAIVTLFSIIQILPTLQNSIAFFSGDKMFHLSKELYLAEKILSGDFYFKLYPHNLGVPLLQLYPWVFDFIVVGIHLFSFTLISVVLAHNITAALVYCSYPAIIYLTLKTFRFPRLVCAVGAIFSIAPISGWGASFNAYYRTGLAAQSISNPLFPFAVIMLYYLLYENKLKPVFFLLSALFVVSHQAAFFMWSIVCAAFFIAHFRMLDLRYDAALFKKIFFISVVLILLCAFWYAPLFEFSKSGLFYAPYPERTSTPVFTGFNTKQLVDSLFRGELFDNVGFTSFVRAMAREGQGFRWAFNINYNRFGIFTIFIILGLIACLRNIRRPRYVFFAVGFLLSISIMLGEDELTLLQYLRFPTSMQYLRFIGILDFFSICLGAIGAFGAAAFIRRRIKLRYNRKISSRVFLYALIIPIFVLLYPERALTNTFTYRDNYPFYKETIKLKDAMKADSKNFARLSFYDKSNYEPLFFSHHGDWSFMMPMITDWVIPQIYIWDHRRYIPEKDSILKLFNIKYVIAETQFKKELEKKGARQKFDILTATPHLMLLKNKTAYQNIEPLLNKPIAVISDNRFWKDINLMWFYAYASGKAGEIFFMKVDPGQLKGGTMQSGALMIAHPRLIKNQEREAVLDYARAGGSVYVFQEIDWLEADPAAKKSIRLIEVEDCSISKLLQAAASESTSAAFQGTIASESFIDPGHYKAVVETLQGRFYLFKYAYFRNWKAKVDGKAVRTYPASPFFIAIYVEKGRHEIEFIWEEMPLIIGGYLVSILTFVVASVGIILRKKQGWGKGLSLASLRSTDGVLSGLVVVAAIATMMFLYVRQSILRIPIMITPSITEEQNPAAVPFKWHRFLDRRALFDLEIYEGDPKLNNAAFRGDRTMSDKFVMKKLKKGTVYRWRMRSEWRKKKYRWSGYRTFHTGYACFMP